MLRPTAASYSSSSSFLTAAICRRSNSVTSTERQRSAARMSAPNISFKTALSPTALGLFLGGARPAAERTQEKFGGPNPPPMRPREAQMGDACLEVIPEACHRAVMLAAIVGHDAGGKLTRNRTARRLISCLHTR